MAETETQEKISVRLSGEPLRKLLKWKDTGLSLSDTVRLALTLLPPTPSQLPETSSNRTPIKLNPPHEAASRPVQEKEALRALQEW